MFWEERERRTAAPVNIVSMSPPSYPSAWLNPCRASFRFTWQSHCSAFSRGLLTARLPLLARLFQLAIARLVDFRLPSGEHVRWRDVADGALKAHRVVSGLLLLDEPPCVFRRQRRTGPDAFPFDRFVPTLDLAVGLGIVW